MNEKRICVIDNVTYVVTGIVSAYSIDDIRPLFPKKLFIVDEHGVAYVGLQLDATLTLPEPDFIVPGEPSPERKMEHLVWTRNTMVEHGRTHPFNGISARFECTDKSKVNIMGYVSAFDKGLLPPDALVDWKFEDVGFMGINAQQCLLLGGLIVGYVASCFRVERLMHPRLVECKCFEDVSRMYVDLLRQEVPEAYIPDNIRSMIGE